MRFLKVSLGLLIVLALAPVPTASAQARAERPYRGLFAGGLGQTGHVLTASGTLGTGWDSNVVADAFGRQGVTDVNRNFEGTVSTVGGGLNYNFTSEAFGFNASASTTGRYYPQFDDPFIVRSASRMGTTSGLNLGKGFTLQGSANYQPFALRALTPVIVETPLGDSTLIEVDYPTSRVHYFSYSAGLEYSNQLSQRTNVNGSYRYTGRVSSSDLEAFSRHNVSAGLTHNLTRNLSLRLGYAYAQSGYGRNVARYGNHIIDAGLNFDRALSLSRRASLTFGTGTSASRAINDGRLRFRAIGNATFGYELGRSWTASANYYRGLQFVETWPEPIFTDAISGGVSGLPTRRMQVQFRVQAVRGSNNRQNLRSDDRLLQYSASSGLTYALGRHVNTGLTYVYYTHDIGANLLLAPGLTNDLRRHSVRVFVSVWAPILQGTRRP